MESKNGSEEMGDGWCDCENFFCAVFWELWMAISYSLWPTLEAISFQRCRRGSNYGNRYALEGQWKRTALSSICGSTLHAGHATDRGTGHVRSAKHDWESEMGRRFARCIRQSLPQVPGIDRSIAIACNIPSGFGKDTSSWAGASLTW